VLDLTGKLIVESILETKAPTIPQLIHGVRGSLYVTFEENLSHPKEGPILAGNPRQTLDS
jgi:hypothetical protein